MRSRSFTIGAGVVLTAGLVTMMSPAAFAQADPPTIGVGCSDAGFWVTTVTAQPGDVVTLVGAGGPSNICTLNLGSTASAKSTTFTGDETLDITILGPGTITVETSLTPTTAPVLTVLVPGSTGPADILQQLPVPDSGACADVADAAFAYGTSAAGGWGRSWARWMNAGSGGAVCSRTLHYSNEAGGWIVL